MQQQRAGSVTVHVCVPPHHGGPGQDVADCLVSFWLAPGWLTLTGRRSSSWKCHSDYQFGITPVSRWGAIREEAIKLHFYLHIILSVAEHAWLFAAAFPSNTAGLSAGIVVNSSSISVIRFILWILFCFFHLILNTSWAAESWETCNYYRFLKN